MWMHISHLLLKNSSNNVLVCFKMKSNRPTFTYRRIPKCNIYAQHQVTKQQLLLKSMFSQSCNSVAVKVKVRGAAAEIDWTLFLVVICAFQQRDRQRSICLHLQTGSQNPGPRLHHARMDLKLILISWFGHKWSLFIQQESRKYRKGWTEVLGAGSGSRLRRWRSHTGHGCLFFIRYVMSWESRCWGRKAGKGHW